MNLRKMYKNLVRVPIPYSYKGNILVMEYIGYEKGPLLLHDYYNSIENKEELFLYIVDQYKKYITGLD